MKISRERKRKKENKFLTLFGFQREWKENNCFTFIPLIIWFVTWIERHTSNFIKKVKISKKISSFFYLSTSFEMRVSLLPLTTTVFTTLLQLVRLVNNRIIDIYGLIFYFFLLLTTCQYDKLWPKLWELL